MASPRALAGRRCAASHLCFSGSPTWKRAPPEMQCSRLGSEVPPLFGVPTIPNAGEHHHERPSARIENQAAYVAGWLKMLRGDSRAVVIAAAQAQRAADYILGSDVPVEEPSPAA